MKENKPKICIVDDTKYNRRMLSLLLTKSNYEVIVAESGEEALEKLEKTPVDLIMLDIIMPGIDGFETCKKIKQLELNKDIPIIFMTSLNDVVDKVKGLSLGAVDYITKPLDPPEVIARVKVHLKLHFLNKQIQEKNELLKKEIQVRAKIEQALWETENTLSTLMSNLPGIAYRRQNNQNWTMELISVGCYKLTGYPPKAFTTGQVSYGKLIHPDDREKIWKTTQIKLQQKLPYQLVYRIITKGGELKWVWEQGREVFQENTQAILEGFITDITDQKAAELALERELKKTLLLKEITEEIRSSLDIKQIFATAARKIGQTFRVNRCTIRIYLAKPVPQIPQVAEYLEHLETGQRSTSSTKNLEIKNLEISVVGNPFAELILAQDKAIAINDISTASILGNSKYVLERFNIKSILITRTSYQGKPNGIISLEHCDMCRHWTEYEIDLLESVASQVGIAIAQAKLLKKEKNQRLELAKLATIDGLTGVANRRQFDECLNKEWKRQMREQKPLALILCDVDYFKLYNDSYGHQAGDKCLKQIAQVLQGYSRRAADLAARYGGEEFAIILPNIEAEKAVKIAEKIRSGVEELQIPHRSSQFGYVTLSLGVSCLIPTRETNSQKLVTLADTALYCLRFKIELLYCCYTIDIS